MRPQKAEGREVGPDDGSCDTGPVVRVVYEEWARQVEVFSPGVMV